MLWEGPAFQAGMTAGTQLLELNGADFTSEALRNAVAGRLVRVRTCSGSHERHVTIRYAGAHRYPPLKSIGGGPRPLDHILAPRR